MNHRQEDKYAICIETTKQRIVIEYPPPKCRFSLFPHYCVKSSVNTLLILDLTKPEMQILFISSILHKIKCEHFIDPGFNKTHTQEKKLIAICSMCRRTVLTLNMGPSQLLGSLARSRRCSIKLLHWTTSLIGGIYTKVLVYQKVKVEGIEVILF